MARSAIPAQAIQIARGQPLLTRPRLGEDLTEVAEAAATDDLGMAAIQT